MKKQFLLFITILSITFSFAQTRTITSKLKITDTPTATATDALLAIQADGLIVKTSIQTGVIGLYDGIDTTVNILLKNPTTFLNETWWSIDEKCEYKAVTSIPQGSDVWQANCVKYDPSNDTFTLSTSQDGQTQNIGQEMFVSAFNSNSSGATQLNPKVFLVTNVKAGEENVKTIIKANANDLFQGAIYGLNTTSATIGEYTKLVVKGDINNVNTSAFLQGARLFVDVISGELTDVKPSSAIFFVGTVDKSDATQGIIHVNTISGAQGESTAIPTGLDRVHFTADETTLNSTTFFLAKRNDVGILASDTTTALVPDNSIVAATQNIIGVPLGFPFTFPKGLFTGQVQFQVNGTQGEQRIRLELYIADASTGAAIDSGITSEPTGTLGVKTFIRMTSQLLDVQANTTSFAILQGQLSEDVTLTASQIVRTVILCEKIGAAGGDLTFTIFAGNLSSSFVDTPTLFRISDNIDVDTSGSTTNNFLKLNGSAIWQGSVVEISDVNTLQTSLDAKLPLAGGTMSGTIANFESTGIDDNATSTAITIDASENVGIGETSPDALLHIKEVDGVEGQLKIEGGNNVVLAEGEINSSLLFGSNDSSVDGTGEGLNRIAGKIASITELPNGAKVGMGFYTFDQAPVDSNDRLREVMRLNNAGNLGIGTSTPSEKLQVLGNIKASGTINTIGILSAATATAITIDASQNVTFTGSITGSNLSGTNTGDQNKADIDALLIDAATLDGIDSSSFLRSNVADIKTTGDLRFFNSVKATFGTNDGLDMDLFHDSANGKLELNTGNFLIRDGSTTRFTFGRTTGDLDITGNLTSLGIDDNATSTAITIDDSENVGIGQPTPLSQLHLHKTGSLPTISATTQLLISNIVGSNVGISILSSSTAGNSVINFGDELDENAGDLFYSNAADRFSFRFSGSSKLNITKEGNLGLGTLTFGTGDNILGISNGVAPTTNPVNSIVLYAEDVNGSSELKVRDEAGNVTVLSDLAAPSFAVFTALISQTGNNIPTLIILENTLGETTNAVRLSSGNYDIDFTGTPFTDSSKVGPFISGIASGEVLIKRLDSDTISIFSANSSGIGSDSELVNIFIEIRVYN